MKTTFTVNKEKLTLVMERTFDASREKVYKIITDPILIPQWWGPKYLSTTVDKFDFKLGGSWRYVQKAPSGDTFAFHGVYKTIIPLELVSSTFNFEGIPAGHEVVETIIFEEIGEKTKVTNTSVFQNLQDLEGMVSSGAESGAKESWERLAELVEKLV